MGVRIRRGAVGVTAATLLLSGCGLTSGLGGAPAATSRASSEAEDDADPSRSGGSEGSGRATTEDAETAPGAVTLAFAGDVHFEQGLAGLLDEPDSTLGPLSSALRSADVAMVNLESALTDGGSPTSKELETADNRYWFRSPPRALDLLARSGVDVVTVANNHGADYGRAGLRDTLREAASGPVAVVGVGRSAADAFAPYRTSVDGTDVAVLAADGSMLESRDAIWTAGKGGPGLASARTNPARQLLAAVRSAAATDDVVAVYLHWGTEYEGRPTAHQRRLAADLAEAGADVVVGTHAHRLLGAGMLGDTYVAYGLGNFLWYHGAQSETGVLRVTLAGGEVVGDEWVPGAIAPDGGQPSRLRGAARARAVEDWQSLRGSTDLARGPSDPPARAADPAPSLAPSPAPSPAPPEDEPDRPAYAASVRPIGPALRARMTSSHDPATCPVSLADLRHVTVSYVGFDGAAHTGELVVAADVAGEVTQVFRRLYAAEWPIRRMRLVDEYAGDDDRSMAADNSSAYNCRRVAGQTNWSDHAYGRAIDLNPVENPYVTAAGVAPPAGRRFESVDRDSTPARAGVIGSGDVVTRAFERFGWTWGGTWNEPDYQHFSAP